MFTGSYFPNSYFTRSFWPKAGADSSPLSADTVSLDFYVDQSRAQTLFVMRAPAQHLYVDRTREVTLERQ